MVLSNYKSDKEVVRMEGCCYLVHQISPYPVAENNSYLIESADGWTVIDVGVDIPENRDLWRRALKIIGISFTQIKKIIITHCHPDHLGAAKWLQHKSQAPVYIFEEELQRAKHFLLYTDDFEARYKDACKYQLNLHGMPQDLQVKLIRDWHLAVAPLCPEPDYILTLKENQEVELAGVKHQIIPIPAHTDGQIMILNPVTKNAFCADLVSSTAYLHFSDWPNTFINNPLKVFEELKTKIGNMDTINVYPGHGPSFVSIFKHMEKNWKNYLKRLEKIYVQLDKPISAWELNKILYKLEKDAYIHVHRVTLGETIGCLEYLLDKGDIKSELRDDKKVYFREARG